MPKQGRDTEMSKLMPTEGDGSLATILTEDSKPGQGGHPRPQALVRHEPFRQARFSKGQRVTHPTRGAGIIGEVAMSAIKRYAVNFDSGERHCYSEESSKKLSLWAELEVASEKVHEEWREKRRKEMVSLGAKLPVPAWKRLPLEEYEAWAHTLPSGVLATIHRFRSPNPTNPTAPAEDDGPPGENAVHWCDIDQSYAYLPESWKANNRQYAVIPEVAVTPVTADRAEQILELEHMLSRIFTHSDAEDARRTFQKCPRTPTCTCMHTHVRSHDCLDARSLEQACANIQDGCQ